MAEVKKIQDGQWIKPQYENYTMQCCRCGLKHRMEFRVTLPGPGLEMRGFRIEDDNGDSKSIL